MKDTIDRSAGVIDPDGIVVAASDLSQIGTSKGNLSDRLKQSDMLVITDNGYTYKLIGQGSISDYTVFVEGEDNMASAICSMAVIAIKEAGIYFEENHDKRAFVKTIITENILPGDVFVKAKELHLKEDVARGVMVIRLNTASAINAIDLVQETFPDKQNDYVISTSETDIVIVKEMPPHADTIFLSDLAKMVQEKLEQRLSLETVIGVGTPAFHLRELAERYKQALIAIDIGRVFETGKSIVSYENLGISRLIYQLPTTLCDIFLTEVFKRNPIEALDQETLFTIDKFFENSLNVSETARKLYVHRNTLVYRLDKIKKITGLDLREFDHAIVFKVALMVKKYLISQEPNY